MIEIRAHSEQLLDAIRKSEAALVGVRLMRAYPDHGQHLTAPADVKLGVTTSDDGGCW